MCFHPSRYDFLLRQINQGKATRKRGLLTVSNHTSVFDDPVLQSSVVGFQHSDNMRWGVCKQHICFSNAFVSSFTSAGKVRALAYESIVPCSIVPYCPSAVVY
jgi:hypothetical protein